MGQPVLASVPRETQELALVGAIRRNSGTSAQPPELARYRTGNSLICPVPQARISKSVETCRRFFRKAKPTNPALSPAVDYEFALATKIPRTTMKLCQQPGASKSAQFAASKLGRRLSNADFVANG